VRTPSDHPANYTPPTSTVTTEHAQDHAAQYFRSHDDDARDIVEYDDDLDIDLDLDSSAYGVTSSTRPEVRRVTSSARPEVRRPLVVDIYAVSDTRRRHDTASHVVYSWSRDAVTSLDGYDDDYEEDYYYYNSDVIDGGSRRRGAGHVTSYSRQGRPGSKGHEVEKSLGQSGGWREDKTTTSNNAAEYSLRRRVITIATTAAAAAATVNTVRAVR